MLRKAFTSKKAGQPAESLADVAANLLLINDWIANALTPPRYRASWLWPRPGEILAALPAVLLFLPLMTMFDRFYTHREGLAVIVMFAWVTVAAFRMVGFGRAQIAAMAGMLDQIIDPGEVPALEEEIRAAFAPIHQMKAGGVFTVVMALLVQVPPQVFFATPWIKASVTFATAYTAWFVGMALFIVVRFRRVSKILSGARYITHGLLPYQTPQLKQISEASPLISLVGAIAAIVPTLIFIFFGLKYNVHLPMYYLFLAVIITATTWLMITIPFLAIQDLLTEIIKHAKAEKILVMQKATGQALARLEAGDLSAVELLERLQKMTTDLHQSPNSVYGSRALSQYITSVLLTLLPIIAGALFR